MTIGSRIRCDRRQITFDALDRKTGEVHGGRIAATPDAVRGRVERFPGERIHVGIEAGTGWLFVREALSEADATPHIAEPAEPLGGAVTVAVAC